jgi:flagellar hook protein FlgE
MVASDGTPVVVSTDATSFTIQQNGTLLYTMADGTTEEGQSLGVAKVTNPEGLEKIGGSLYRVTPNAITDGTIELTTANNAETGTGAIVAGQLEMIVAQRGFQANSRIITTSDSILEEIVNLKR